MNKNKLEMWKEQISSYERISMSQAKKLYTEYKKEKDNIKKSEIRNKIICGMMSYLPQVISNRFLDSLNSSSYDIDDIINLTVEYMIRKVDEGSLLKINSFANIFSTDYYNFLYKNLIPESSEDFLSNDISETLFADCLEDFINLKSEKGEFTLLEFCERVSHRKNAGEYCMYHVSEIDALYVMFNEMYADYEREKNRDADSTNNKNDYIENISKTKEKMKKLKKFYIAKYLNGDITNLEDETDCFEKANSRSVIKSLFECKNLKDQEREFLKLRYGLEDGDEKTFQEVADMFNLTRQRAQQVEESAINKLEIRARRSR